MSILNRDRLIVFVHGACREPLTLEQCTLRAYQLSERVKAADAALLAERVRLGVLLLQVRRDLKRGEWGIWLAGGGVHQKTAERCMRYAARFADTRGELDRQKLFDCLHAADAEMFPSIEKFDEHRVSLVRVDRAIAVGEADDWTGPQATPNRMGRSTSSSIISAKELPRARVGDVAGQGVLHGLFAPFARRLEEFAESYCTFDGGKRRKAEAIIERCDRELKELMVGTGVGTAPSLALRGSDVRTSDIPHPTSDIAKTPAAVAAVALPDGRAAYSNGATSSGRHDNDTSVRPV